MKKKFKQLLFFVLLVALHSQVTAQGQGSNSQNTSVGFQSLFSNTTGYSNTATGYRSLYSNTTGLENTATGFHSMFSNTEGFFNSAHGAYSLFSNTTGNDNVAIGWRSLYSNTTGSANTATGLYALLNNTTGGFNTAHGAQSLFFNTTGVNNTANGGNALFYNSTGYDNTATGVAALFNNTTGFFNTATGAYSLYTNLSGNSNTANGWRALSSNSFGNANTAMGLYALVNNVGGGGNTAHGTQSLFFNTSGYNNTAIGLNALLNNTSGLGNTGLGYNANVISGNLFNATAIGFNSVAVASNSVRVGNSSVTSIGGQVGWTTFSDGRYKNNIKDNVPGLEFINKLQPITYTLDAETIENKLRSNQKKTTSDERQLDFDEVDNSEMKKAIADKSKIVYTGFAAQEVEKAAKEIGYDFSGVDKPENENEAFYGLRYDEFVVPLVKAVQELSEQNESLKTTNAELNERLRKIEALLVKELKNDIVNSKTVLLSSARLDQNIPNPTSSSTLINYFIPANASHAEMQVKTMSGEMVKRVELPAKGKGQLTLQTNTLSAGTYSYSLVVDGVIVDTKKMVRVK